MNMIESLEARRLLDATVALEPGNFGRMLRIALNDVNEVRVDIQDGHIQVTSHGQTIGAFTPIFGNPVAREIRIDGGHNGGDSIRLVSDYPVRYEIIGGTGDDVIHVEGVEGAGVTGTIHGNNGTDVFALVNATGTVFGDNGDDICTLVNAGNSVFDGGRGDDLELLA